MTYFNRQLTLALVVLGLVTSIGSAIAADSEKATANQASGSSFPSSAVIEGIFKQRIEENRGVGYVLGMVNAKGETRIVAYGSAGPDAKSLSADSVFEIGSITKTFTSSLLADMVVRGEVRLDQPVQELMPEGVSIPQRDGRQITLVDLATHTSSLPRLPENMPMADPSNPYADYTEEMMFEYLSSYELPIDIGTEFGYSNLGTGLLGYALGRVHGGGYQAALQERIFQPLGMNSTDLEFSDEMSANAVKGHDAQGQVVPYWDLTTLAGAGAILSDMNDMLLYLKANMNPQTDTWKEITDLTHSVKFKGPPEIGLNWIHTPSDGDDLIWHNGGTGGFRTFMGFVPERNVGLVLLTNTTTSADDIAMHLFDPKAPLTPAYVSPAKVDIDPETLGRFVGVYELTPEFLINMFVKDDALVAQATGQGEIPLVAQSETGFFVEGMPIEVFFEVGEDGGVTSLTLSQSGADQKAKKIK
jgi:D-alanyl-D-alanine-carboxypeptidase/D-alanyl-D-alanine-endopeptidase